MKANALIWVGTVFALSGFAIGRFGIRSAVASPEALQALIIGCVIAGLVLVVVGVVVKTLR